MRFITLIIITLTVTSCANKKQKDKNKNLPSNQINQKVETKTKPFKMDFDKTSVSDYKIENKEHGNTKAMVKSLSEYSTKELKELPNSKRLTLYIIVPTDITKNSLANTFKSIVNNQTKSDKDIDEIVIFAYDNKNDIGKIQYTFGKMVWAPNGKTGNMTPEIAKSNNRNSYKFDIIIKDKVGNIKKEDKPNARELKIYNEIMSDKYIDMQDEESNPIIMKKFNIKSEKELKKIFLKVAVYKQ